MVTIHLLGNTCSIKNKEEIILASMIKIFEGVQKND